MKRSYYIVLISVFVFIALNTIFYINIYKRQIAFQTELLTQQIRICGNTIEKMGMSFENEVNFILFSDDITRLFYDPSIKEIGSKNLELFYSKYAQLINKITVYDNKKNVYGLILDKKNNFVSDYYESQRQVPLQDRDCLYFENGKSYFTIPIFRDNQVHSNIRIEINFNRYLQSVFDQYKLENTLWQWLLTGEGDIDTTFTSDLRIHPGQLEKIGNDIFEEIEGSIVHTINRNGESKKVISVYQPVRLIRRDYGIVFSIETDLFLQSIYLKTIIITVASLLLLALILFVHFRIINVQTRRAVNHAASGGALYSSINQIPTGIVMINSDNSIRIINQAALELLMLNPEDKYIGETAEMLHLERLHDKNHPVYSKVFGKGYVFPLKRNNIDRILYISQWDSVLDNEEVKYIMLYDITHFERSGRLGTVAHIEKTGLLDKMKHEFDVPLNNLRDALVNLTQNKPKGSDAEKIATINHSVDLLENLVKATFDFTSLEPDKMVVDEIPFILPDEINLAIEPFKNTANTKNLSIITKFLDEIPEKLVGDPFRLKLVLKSLLENAMETTREGRILISAESLEHKFNSVIIKINIEDTGTGYSGEVINEFSDPANYSNSNDYWKDQYGDTGLRLAIVKKNIDLLKGSVIVESPSSISTNPDSPGTICSFYFECCLGDIKKREYNNKEINNFRNIHCLVLSQDNDPDEESYRLIEDIGVSINHMIYRKNNLESVTEYLRERKSDLHILFIIDKPGSDGFVLVSELFKQDLSEDFYIILSSTNNSPDNYHRARKYLVDLYLSEPFESYTIFEFIKSRFPGISDVDFQKAPKGVRINTSTSILVADNNLFNRKIARALFKMLGFEADLANNGEEIMEMVKNKQYDIIFMDILISGKGGLHITTELRKQGHNMPVIGLIAADLKKSKAEASIDGINDYLIKPLSMESIRKILLQSFSEKA